MEDNHDKQDDKVLVDGQGQADENGVENDTKLEDCDTDELGRRRVGASAGERGSGFLVAFLAVNVVMAARGVAPCERNLADPIWRPISDLAQTLGDTEAGQACGTPSEGEELDDE